MLKSKYKAFEIQDALVSETVVEGNRIAIADFIKNCKEEREKRGFEKPQQKEYALVYEGEVDTFSLEDVWEKFGRRVPRDFEGHALSISDVVEFSEEEVSRYFYVEPKGFAEITFKLE